ncbi:hypothetical protein ACFV4N_38350 [Actinosynnema sp. NPDC059797]
MAPRDRVTGPAVPDPDLARLDLGRVDLGVELEGACEELHDHLARGDREMAHLLGAWIDALLDEWNRRRRC